MTEAYPLAWPVTWPRSKFRVSARFDTSFASARDALIREIRMLGGNNVVISTNVKLKRDGFPYASFEEPADPGVSVYFTLDGQQQCFPCDKWNRVTDNLQAIRCTIGALRGIERWGSGEMMKATFQGFAALPPPSDGSGIAKDYFAGLNHSDDLRAKYRELCMKLHPDRGGNPEEFAEMVRQYKAKGMSE